MLYINYFVIISPDFHLYGLIIAIRVLSLDFDGCLFNQSYEEAAVPEKDIIKYNQKFLDEIKAENAAFVKVCIFVGSIRQSYTVDRDNSLRSNRGSCYPAIVKISKYLNI